MQFRRIPLLSAMLLLLVLCACQKTPTPAPTLTPEPTPEPRFTFTRQNFPRLNGSTSTVPLAEAEGEAAKDTGFRV